MSFASWLPDLPLDVLAKRNALMMELSVATDLRLFARENAASIKELFSRGERETVISLISEKLCYPMISARDYVISKYFAEFTEAQRAGLEYAVARNTSMMQNSCSACGKKTEDPIRCKDLRCDVHSWCGEECYDASVRSHRIGCGSTGWVRPTAHRADRIGESLISECIAKLRNMLNIRLVSEYIPLSVQEYNKARAKLSAMCAQRLYAGLDVPASTRRADPFGTLSLEIAHGGTRAMIQTDRPNREIELQFKRKMKYGMYDAVCDRIEEALLHFIGFATPAFFAALTKMTSDKIDDAKVAKILSRVVYARLLAKHPERSRIADKAKVANLHALIFYDFLPLENRYGATKEYGFQRITFDFLAKLGSFEGMTHANASLTMKQYHANYVATVRSVMPRMPDCSVPFGGLFGPSVFCNRVVIGLCAFLLCQQLTAYEVMVHMWAYLHHMRKVTLPFILEGFHKHQHELLFVEYVQHLLVSSPSAAEGGTPLQRSVNVTRMRALDSVLIPGSSTTADVWCSPEAPWLYVSSGQRVIAMSQARYYQLYNDLADFPDVKKFLESREDEWQAVSKLPGFRSRANATANVRMAGMASDAVPMDTLNPRLARFDTEEFGHRDDEAANPSKMRMFTIPEECIVRNKYSTFFLVRFIEACGSWSHYDVWNAPSRARVKKWASSEFMEVEQGVKSHLTYEEYYTAMRTARSMLKDLAYGWPDKYSPEVAGFVEKYPSVTSMYKFLHNQYERTFDAFFDNFLGSRLHSLDVHEKLPRDFVTQAGTHAHAIEEEYFQSAMFCDGITHHEGKYTPCESMREIYHFDDGKGGTKFRSDGCVFPAGSDMMRYLILVGIEVFSKALRGQGTCVSSDTMRSMRAGYDRCNEDHVRDFMETLYAEMPNALRPPFLQSIGGATELLRRGMCPVCCVKLYDGQPEFMHDGEVFKEFSSQGIFSECRRCFVRGDFNRRVVNLYDDWTLSVERVAAHMATSMQLPIIAGTDDIELHAPVNMHITMLKTFIERGGSLCDLSLEGAYDETFSTGVCKYMYITPMVKTPLKYKVRYQNQGNPEDLEDEDGEKAQDGGCVPIDADFGLHRPQFVLLQSADREATARRCYWSPDPKKNRMACLYHALKEMHFVETEVHPAGCTSSRERGFVGRPSVGW